jgi:hypothetical protein
VSNQTRSNSPSFLSIALLIASIWFLIGSFLSSSAFAGSITVSDLHTFEIGDFKLNMSRDQVAMFASMKGYEVVAVYPEPDSTILTPMDVSSALNAEPKPEYITLDKGSVSYDIHFCNRNPLSRNGYHDEFVYMVASRETLPRKKFEEALDQDKKSYPFLAWNKPREGQEIGEARPLGRNGPNKKAGLKLIYEYAKDTKGRIGFKTKMLIDRIYCW